tara:strand:- start:1774 stop:1989 length:216 start_codon:yes stop_codon:yes gene_type:complete
MRVSNDDRDRFIECAELCGMSLNAFANQAISAICDLIDADGKKLPHSRDIEIVKVGQFLKNTKLSDWKKKR